MANEFSTVDCCEVHGSASEAPGQDGATASVQLQCAWLARWDLMNDLLGNRRAWPYAAGLRASSCSCVSLGDRGPSVGQTIQYDQAIVTVNYSSKEEEDLVSESLEPNVEFLTADHKQFRWGSATGDPLLENEAPGYRLYSLTLNRTLYKVASVPASILTLPGTVNNGNYSSTLLGLTFATGTLLFQPKSLNRTLTTAGSKGWDVTVAFLFKPEGWNKFYRAKTQTYEEIFHVEAGVVHENYPPASFAAWLF